MDRLALAAAVACYLADLLAKAALWALVRMADRLARRLLGG